MMNDKKVNKNKIERNLSEEDLERLEILQKSEEIKGEQLLINLDSEIIVENQAKKLLGQKIDDPVQKFQLPNYLWHFGIKMKNWATDIKTDISV